MADDDFPQDPVSRPVYTSKEDWPSHQWVEKMYAENHPFPYSRNRQFAIPFDLDENGRAQGFASAQLTPNSPREARIDWLEAGPQRQGYGSKALRSIMQSATDHNIALSLFPWGKGNVSKTTLTRFYKQHGFKQEKGGRMYFDPSDIKKAEGGAVDNDGITAYHGSPHEFEQFDLSKVGTGEGAQSYGHGLYFAEQEPIAINYRDRLAKEGPSTGESIADYFAIDKGTHKFMSDEDIEEHLEDIGRQAVRTLFEDKKLKFVFEDGSVLTKEKDHFRAGQKEKGHVYEVNINAHPDHFLDWDKPLLEQPEVATKLFNGPDFIKNAARQAVQENNDITYGELHGHLAAKHPRGQQGLTEHLQEIGIPGIKYFDAGSRRREEGSRNYVVFDDKLVKTKRRYAEGGIVAE